MAEQSVTLQPGESKIVAFEVSPSEARVYHVSVDGLTGSFEVKEALTYTCPYCLTPLGSLAEFFNHLESVHFYMPEYYFYCPYSCGAEFSTLQAFFSHLEAEHLDDITAPPITPPSYLLNLTVRPAIVRQWEDATISGSFVGPFDPYTSYRLAFYYQGRREPRAYGRITSAGAFSLTLPTEYDRGRKVVPAGSYAITTSCAYRHDPPGGPITERTIWLNANTGLVITILPA